MTTGIWQCSICSHFLEPEAGKSRFLAEPRCEAFPDGIPYEIQENWFDHRKPFEGDNGIRFELREGVELLEERPSFGVNVSLDAEIEEEENEE